MNSRALPVVALLLAILLLPAGGAAAASGSEANGLTSIAGLKGKDILGPGGKRLGIVKDVLASRDGDFTFIVLAQGSAFGEIGPYHLMPWQIAAPQIRDDALVIAFGETIIEKAPAIRMEVWPPDSFPPEFIERVHSYYRQTLQKNSN